MAVKNAQLVDHDKVLFLVIDLIYIQLPKIEIWQESDIVEPNAFGIEFSGFEKPEGPAILSIIVADVTNDISEPFVDRLNGRRHQFT